MLHRDYYDCYYYHYCYYYNSTESTAQPDRVLATDISSGVRSSHKIHRSFNGVIVFNTSYSSKNSNSNSNHSNPYIIQ